MFFFLEIQIKRVGQRFAVWSFNADRCAEADERLNAVRQIFCNEAMRDGVRRFYVLIDRIIRKQLGQGRIGSPPESVQLLCNTFIGNTKALCQGGAFTVNSLNIVGCPIGKPLCEQ